MSLISKGLRLVPFVRRSIYTSQPKRKAEFPDAWDIVTGVERWEAIQHSKGNTDPFMMQPIKRGPGTKDCPNIIRSPYDKRMVGCKCSTDSHHIVWWWIHEGFPRRCECNYWFVLERFELPKVYEDRC